MEHRIGKCSACGAQYKIPASFEANKAKCKKCGGVVAIGPVQRPAPDASKAPPVPARKPAEAHAKKKEPGQASMKERLLAERRAAEQKAEPEEKKPARRARAGAGAGSRRAGGASSRSSARRGGGRGRRGKDADAGAGAGAEADAEDGDSPRGRRQHKKSPAPLVGAIVIVIVAAFGVWKFALSPDEAQAGDGETAVADAGPVTPAEPVALEAPDPEPTDAPTDEPVDEPEEPAADKPKKIADPSSLDLFEEFPEDFGPAEGCSEEQWTDIKQLVATMLDPEAGAAGNRARKSLLEIGKFAFPAVLNSMKRLDYGTDSGYRDGDLCQKLLMDICHGNNFGWRYTIEPDDHLFNKKVVRQWHVQWDKARESEEYWIKLAKLDKADAPQGKPALGVEESELDALDDF